MATWEQRRRGILRTALEMEQDLFRAENRYVAELAAGMSDMRAELGQAMARMNVQPRADGNFDWERWQTETLLAEINRQIDTWQNRFTSTVQSGTTAADEMGAQFPLDILSAGGSDIRVQPRLSGTQLAMFHAYDAGLVKGVSDRTRAEVTGLVRRAALGGDSVFNLMGRIGDVTGKGAFATAFHRGEAIIRTEMGRSYSSADMSTMWQTAADHPGLQKKWLSIIDGRTRPEHAKAHDQVRPLLIPFSVGGEKLMHPHDTNGSAWNTINCRCKAVPWDPAWEKLPPPGTKQLGPLALADTASFQQHLANLDRMPGGSTKFTYADQQLVDRGGTRTAIRDMNDEMVDYAWPVPMNPAFWRTKNSFTALELDQLSSSNRMLSNFLRERFGITLVHDAFFDKDNTFSSKQRFKLTRALEAYRALDPAFVVENPHLRFIGTSGGKPANTLGEASVFGDIAFNTRSLSLITRARDPKGQTAPRLSDDAELESMLHEVGHAVAFRAAMPMTFQYSAAAALPPKAWDDFREMWRTSTQISNSQMALKAGGEQLARASDHLAALQAAGTPKSSPEYKAAEADYVRLFRWVDELKANVGMSGSGGIYPSQYAAKAFEEDFAESAALAILSPAEFKRDYPTRYAWFNKWLPKMVGG